MFSGFFCQNSMAFCTPHHAFSFRKNIFCRGQHLRCHPLRVSSRHQPVGESRGRIGQSALSEIAAVISMWRQVRLDLQTATAPRRRRMMSSRLLPAHILEFHRHVSFTPCPIAFRLLSHGRFPCGPGVFPAITQATGREAPACRLNLSSGTGQSVP